MPWYGDHGRIALGGGSASFNASGALSIDPASGQNLTISPTGGGDISFITSAGSVMTMGNAASTAVSPSNQTYLLGPILNYNITANTTDAGGTIDCSVILRADGVADYLGTNYWAMHGTGILAFPAGSTADLVYGVGGGIWLGHSTLGYNYGGATTTAAAFLAAAPNSSGTVTGTITTVAGVYVANQANADLTGSFNYGIYVQDQTGGALAIGIYVAGGANGGVWIGSSSRTGTLVLQNTLSQTIILTMPGSGVTSWTMTLPTTAGTSGQQLQTDGAGVTSWAAAGSSQEWKNILGTADPEECLDRLLRVSVYDFRYKPDAQMHTGDLETVYRGVVSEEAPWAMHFNEEIFSPVSAFGHTVGAIQALERRVRALENRFARAV